MLLGAALIGVLTTYFFLKAKYTKIIDELEGKLETAKREAADLKSELSSVQEELDGVKKELEEVKKKEK
jgi:predicted  nucleic acid-binding Zn-ribbon protein